MNNQPAGRDALLDRIELILDVFQTGEPLTLTQIMQQCDLPRATIHRSLQQMVRLRWISRIGNKYQLGIRLFEFGTAAIRTHWFHKIAYPYLVDLHKESNTVVHLGFLQGADVLYWDKVGGQLSDSVPTRIGDRQKAHTTALGQALLAEMPNSYFAVASQANRPSGSSIVRGTEGLSQTLARVRVTGVAFDLEETTLGVGCIGASTTAGYHSGGDVTIGSISVCAPIGRIKSDRSLAVMVRRAANDISRAAASYEG